MLFQSAPPPPLARIFSKADVQRLVENLVPEDASSMLLVLRKNPGLIKASTVHRRLQEIVLDENQNDTDGILTIKQLAEILDISEHAISAFLPDDDDDGGWIFDEETVITRKGYRTILNDLFTLLDQKPVLVSDFSKAHGISVDGFRRVVEENNDAIDPASTESEKEDRHIHYWGEYEAYAYTLKYARPLSERIEDILTEATGPTILEASSFDGSPPFGILEETVKNILEARKDIISGQLKKQGSELLFTPKSYIKGRIDDLVAQLETGNLEPLRYRTLTDLDPSIDDPRGFIIKRCGDHVLTMHDSAMSTACVDAFTRDLVTEISGRGYSALKIPMGLSEKDTPVMEEILLKNASKPLETDDDSLEIAEQYVISKKFRTDLHERCHEDARRQARERYRKGAKGVYQPLSIHEFLGQDASMADPEIPRILLGKNFRREAEDTFRREMDRLEADDIAAFSQFWSDRVDVKFQLHCMSVEALANEKLRDELAAALVEHIMKSLVPDTMKKADERGLLRAKPVKKGLETIRQSINQLEKNQIGAQETLNELDKTFRTFNATLQLIRHDDVLVQKKRMLVQEMVSNMQPIEDGPRLFLSLLVIIHASLHPGLLYATGRFAPRLLKQLGDAVSPDQREQLSRFKDAAKAGAVTGDLKDQMLSMARSFAGPAE
ncbi:MAG: hypothetical protein M1823_006215 [Watsoniomyces obsoletus]|nr:MAG: hypothetical protein M1823_006215 [Watsoniomyces obsoletus]